MTRPRVSRPSRLQRPAACASTSSPFFSRMITGKLMSTPHSMSEVLTTRHGRPSASRCRIAARTSVRCAGVMRALRWKQEAESFRRLKSSPACLRELTMHKTCGSDMMHSASSASSITPRCSTFVRSKIRKSSGDMDGGIISTTSSGRKPCSRKEERIRAGCVAVQRTTELPYFEASSFRAARQGFI